MPRSVFLVELFYLLVLMAAFVVYRTDHQFRDVVPALGPLPASIVWFGALGSVLQGLNGVFSHNRAWDHSYDYWHYSRLWVGAVVGAVGALLYYVSIELGSSDHVTTNALTFDVVAFLLGFGDKAFRQLITKLTGLLISPGKSGG
ncbi:MAG: hypothetical protein ABSC56_03845 [Solirubrobacteraceae bacterium]